MAFQSEYLPATGQRSLCIAMFPPCCLLPLVAENVPYTSAQICAIYTLCNCSVSGGCRDKEVENSNKEMDVVTIGIYMHTEIKILIESAVVEIPS